MENYIFFNFYLKKKKSNTRTVTGGIWAGHCDANQAGRDQWRLPGQTEFYDNHTWQRNRANDFQGARKAGEREPGVGDENTDRKRDEKESIKRLWESAAGEEASVASSSS